MFALWLRFIHFVSFKILMTILCTFYDYKSIYCTTVVKASGMNPLKVPLSKPSQTADGVSVWEWEGSAFDEGYEASKWFSSYLGKESRLVRFNEGQIQSRQSQDVLVICLAMGNNLYESMIFFHF